MYDINAWNEQIGSFFKVILLSFQISIYLSFHEIVEKKTAHEINTQMGSY